MHWKMVSSENPQLESMVATKPSLNHKPIKHWESMSKAPMWQLPAARIFSAPYFCSLWAQMCKKKIIRNKPRQALGEGLCLYDLFPVILSARLWLRKTMESFIKQHLLNYSIFYCKYPPWHHHSVLATFSIPICFSPYLSRSSFLFYFCLFLSAFSASCHHLSLPDPRCLWMCVSRRRAHWTVSKFDKCPAEGRIPSYFPHGI